MKNKIKILLSNLCCSNCKAGFDEDSITINQFGQDFIITDIICQNCGKKFSFAFLGLNNIEVKNPEELPLVVCDGPTPINIDDVIDAHRFINNLDEHWQDYLPKKHL